MKSNVLGLENEKSRIRLGIQGTKSGETTTLEKKQLIRIKHFDFKKSNENSQISI